MARTVILGVESQFFFFTNLQYPVPRMLRKQFQLNRPCSFREELFIDLIIYMLITAILDASTQMFSYILEIISKCFTCKLSSISLAISVKGRLKVFIKYGHSGNHGCQFPILFASLKDLVFLTQYVLHFGEEVV